MLGDSVDRKDKAILPLATALAALTASAVPAAASVPADNAAPASTGQQASAIALTPNTSYTAGEHLFGLLMTKKADGTVVAQHSSHMSHSSHASHASSRF